MDSSLKQFIIKCVVVTICSIIILKTIPVSSYTFIDAKTRGNKFTGEVERQPDRFSLWY